ncbi:hypothetical protein F4604DRAFT_1679155 [Suillus subluteus]|nr:hypothetical protein F4604DRAFT_1679155 [Suillus subluteus]
MADTFDILNCSKNPSLMSASALSSIRWLDLACDGTDANLTGGDSRKLADVQTDNAFDLIKDIFSDQIMVPACKKAFDKDWKNPPNALSSNTGCGWIIEQNNIFQQGSRASVAFELPAVHTSSSRQPPRSAPTINRTQSAPTTHNQIHHVLQSHRQPSQLSQQPPNPHQPSQISQQPPNPRQPSQISQQPPNPLAPPEALGSAQRIAGNQWPNALDLPDQAPFPQTNYLQTRRQRRRVRFNIVSDTSALASIPSSGCISEAPPPLRVRSTPLPPVTLVESDTESDLSSPEQVENEHHGRAPNVIASVASHRGLSNAPMVLNCQACSQAHHHVVISHPLPNSPPPAYRLEAATSPTLLQGAPGRYTVTIDGMVHVVQNSLRNSEGNGT